MTIIQENARVGKSRRPSCRVKGLAARLFILAVFVFVQFIFAKNAAASPGSGADEFGLDGETLKKLQENERDLDFFCLGRSYPAIRAIEERDGDYWIILEGGAQIPYAGLQGGESSGDASLKESMRQIYPLEPARPDFAPDEAPGRKRCLRFLHALYGADARQAQKNLGLARIGGKSVRLAREAADALGRAAPQLEKLWADPALRPYLLPGGGFYWRKIAGENRLSPHAFGIALDIGIKVAPYWRWAKISPHPKQKSYPAAIVRLMEEQGFIWGGKWHEYDLMHFEYRPELICKAKILGAKN